MTASHVNHPEFTVRQVRASASISLVVASRPRDNWTCRPIIKGAAPSHCTSPTHDLNLRPAADVDSVQQTFQKGKKRHLRRQCIDSPLVYSTPIKGLLIYHREYFGDFSAHHCLNKTFLRNKNSRSNFSSVYCNPFSRYSSSRI